MEAYISGFRRFGALAGTFLAGGAQGAERDDFVAAGVAAQVHVGAFAPVALVPAEGGAAPVVAFFPVGVVGGR